MRNGVLFSSILLVSSLAAACGGIATVSEDFPPSGDRQTGGSSSPATSQSGAAPSRTGTENHTVVTEPLCVNATTRIDIAANLDAGTSFISEPWSPADPYANTNFVSMATILDSFGREHDLAVAFRKIDDGVFEYHALVDAYRGASSVAGGTEVAAGTLVFTPSGALDAVVVEEVSPVLFEGARHPQSIVVGFGESIADGGTGLTGTISVASSFLVVGQWQDGAACGVEAAKRHPCAWPLDEQGLLDESALDSICK